MVSKEALVTRENSQTLYLNTALLKNDIGLYIMRQVTNGGFGLVSRRDYIDNGKNTENSWFSRKKSVEK